MQIELIDLNAKQTLFHANSANWKAYAQKRQRILIALIVIGVLGFFYFNHLSTLSSTNEKDLGLKFSFLIACVTLVYAVNFWKTRKQYWKSINENLEQTFSNSNSRKISINEEVLTIQTNEAKSVMTWQMMKTYQLQRDFITLVTTLGPVVIPIKLMTPEEYHSFLGHIIKLQKAKK